MSSAVKVYDNIDMDAGYTACIKSFSSLAAGGQIADDPVLLFHAAAPFRLVYNSKCIVL